MLLRVKPDGYQNMQLSKYSEMVRFWTNIKFPADDEKGIGSITVTYQAPGSSESSTLEIPLQPSTDELETLEVDLYASPVKAHQMPSRFSDWFSKRFGFDVILAYVGDNRRHVLFEEMKPKKGLLGFSRTQSPQIGFADVAPFLIVNKTSIKDVSARLPEGEEVDIVKFRPNIILEGAESAWEEDFWAKLEVNGNEIDTAHNCGRCKSVNIDYDTGEAAKGESGKVLKKLQADRRVDLGIKYSPVFGRYSFWSKKNGDKTLSVGDDVKVTRFNPTRTTWSKTLTSPL
jgi:uncharacterized protein YcbX